MLSTMPKGKKSACRKEKSSSSSKKTRPAATETQIQKVWKTGTT